MVDGVWGNVYLKRCSDGELLYLFGTPKTRYLGQLYKKRWKIEVLFQQIKKRGFDLEATHLNESFKLKKLVGLVSIAYALVTALGVDYHKTVRPIKLKKHGYKENSFARKGINLVREGLRRQWRKDIFIFKRLIHKFIRWIQINPNQLSFI